MNSLFNSEESLNLSLEEFQESYLKRAFLTKVYFYYINDGFNNIILKELMHIFTSSFLIFYTIFLYNCVDWNLIFTISEKTKLKDLINLSHYFKLNIFNWGLFLIFIFITICKIIGLVNSFKDYKFIKKFYNDTLKINDNELNLTKWNTIISKFKEEYKNNDINIYYINHKIACKDNYLITIMNKDILNLSYITTIMEWNIVFCILNSIFDKDIKYNKKFLNNDKVFIQSIKYKLTFIAMLNFIFMPFIFMYILFYYLFKYGEKFYSNPSYIITRNWTLMARWKLRNYNELYHEYSKKFIMSQKPCNEYSNLYPNKILTTINKFLVFILSSIFVVLVFISIINERILINLYITHNKQTIWFIGIIGSFIAILKKNIIETVPDYPKEKMETLKYHINCIPEQWLKNTQNKNKDFFNYYQLQYLILLKDFYYTLMIPFELYKMSLNTKNIMIYLNSITINTSYGHTNKFSLFYDDMNTSEIVDDKKQYSLETFKRNNDINILV